MIARRKLLTQPLLFFAILTYFLFVPHTSVLAADYANTDLPKVIDMKLSGDLISSQQIKLVLEMTIQTKVNPLKSVSAYLRSPKRDPLKPPCEGQGGFVSLTLSGEGVGTKTYKLERTIRSESSDLCPGDYKIGIEDSTITFNLVDVADHELRLMGNISGQTLYSAQYSNIWSSVTGVKPQCDSIGDISKGWGPYNAFKVCDLGFDFPEKLKTLSVAVTSDMLLKAKEKVNAEAEAKAKAEAEAKAKAEAEAKAKAEAEAKAKAEAAKKKKTITCVKGKITKKVKAVNPKCPTGYKRK